MVQVMLVSVHPAVLTAIDSMKTFERVCNVQICTRLLIILVSVSTEVHSTGLGVPGSQDSLDYHNPP